MVRFRTNVIATNNNTNIIATIVLYGKIFYGICDWKSFLLLFLFFIFESRFHASVKKIGKTAIYIDPFVNELS